MHFSCFNKYDHRQRCGYLINYQRPTFQASFWDSVLTESERTTGIFSATSQSALLSSSWLLPSTCHCLSSALMWCGCSHWLLNGAGMLLGSIWTPCHSSASAQTPQHFWVNFVTSKAVWSESLVDLRGAPGMPPRGPNSFNFMRTARSSAFGGGSCPGDPLDRDPQGPLWEETPLDRDSPKGTWDKRQRPPRRNMEPGSQTGNDIIQRPPQWTKWVTEVTNRCKIIPLSQTSFSGGYKLWMYFFMYFSGTGMHCFTWDLRTFNPPGSCLLAPCSSWLASSCPWWWSSCWSASLCLSLHPGGSTAWHSSNVSPYPGLWPSWSGRYVTSYPVVFCDQHCSCNGNGLLSFIIALKCHNFLNEWQKGSQYCERHRTALHKPDDLHIISVMNLVCEWWMCRDVIAPDLQVGNG